MFSHLRHATVMLVVLYNCAVACVVCEHYPSPMQSWNSAPPPSIILALYEEVHVSIIYRRVIHFLLQKMIVSENTIERTWLYN